MTGSGSRLIDSSTKLLAATMWSEPRGVAAAAEAEEEAEVEAEAEVKAEEG